MKRERILIKRTEAYGSCLDVIAVPKGGCVTTLYIEVFNSTMDAELDRPPNMTFSLPEFTSHIRALIACGIFSIESQLATSEKLILERVRREIDKRKEQ